MSTNLQTAPRKLVTVFVGSGRARRGATYAAARQLVDELEARGDVRGEIVALSQQQLGLCRGCKRCFEQGRKRCPLGGDFESLFERMMRSDVVVFASPNYSFQISAIMKSFLDRLGFVFHRPRFHGKIFSEIVVQGFYGGGRIQKYLRFVGAGLGFDVVKGTCITALEPMTDRDRQKMSRSLAQQCRRIRTRLGKPAYATPSLFELMVFRMSRTSIRLLLGEDNRDFVYYRDRGWFESDYYYPTRLGTLKRAAGALFDWLFARKYRRQSTDAALARSSRDARLLTDASES